MGIDAHTITDGIDVTRIRPTQDHVLLQVLERNRSSGGIHIVGGAQTCTIGRVLALGRGTAYEEDLALWRPWDLKVGDLVLSMGYSGERMEHYDGPEYRIIRSHGLWARVTLKNAEALELATIEPRMQCVVVLPQDETKWGSIYLATGLAESSNRRGKVVSVGPGPWRKGQMHRDPVPLKPGDQIAFMRAAGAEVEVDGRWLRIMVEEDVRGIVEGME